MNTDLLTTLAAQFAQALATPDLQTHLADHTRRAARAQTLLTPERLPTLKLSGFSIGRKTTNSSPRSAESRPR